MSQKLPNAMRELKTELAALAKSSDMDFEKLKRGIFLYQEMLKQSQARWYRTHPSHRRVADQLSSLLGNSSDLTAKRIANMADVWLKEGRVKRTGFFGDSVLHRLLSGYVHWHESHSALCLSTEQQRELATHKEAIQQNPAKKPANSQQELPVAPLQQQGFFNFQRKNNEKTKTAPEPVRSSLKIN